METRVQTLVVTDLVQGVGFAHAPGATEAAALARRHDRLARELVRDHGGREIDKTDGFLLLFPDPEAAAEFSVAYHRALASLGLRGRVGVHRGDVVLRENAPDDVARGAKPVEVEGVAKATTARIMSLARPGQSLASPSARERLPDSFVVVSHGHWRLKGVAAPIELVEFGLEGEAPFEPPSDAAKAWRVLPAEHGWRPARDVTHALPAERDRFVGRRTALRRLARTFEGGARLVTLQGVGGTGKTRLAIRYGRGWRGGYPGGVALCDLSTARSLDELVFALARVLGVQLGADGTEALGRALGARGRALLILDNVEQLAAQVGPILDRWRQLAPETRFLVTSRAGLGVPGEVVLPLAPLSPADAAELFHSRARQSFPSYRPDPSVPTLVARLDCLPLAIELAAARVRELTVADINERVETRLDLLDARGGRASRHLTLRAMIDWSWGLLQPSEQAVLAQLSVFEGGFSLQGVRHVVALEAAEVDDALRGLVDKSLVVREADDRYRLLVSVHTYARERLGTGPTREALVLRHARWFASLVEAPWFDGPEFPREDYSNGIAALERAIARADLPLATHLIGPLGSLCFRLGLGRRPIEASIDALRDLGLTPVQEALVGSLDQRLPPDTRASRVRVFEAAGEWVHLANELMVDGFFRQDEAPLRRALEIAKEQRSPYVECWALTGLARVEARQGRHDETLALQRRAVELARGLPNPFSLQAHLGNLTSQLAILGHYEEAASRSEELLQLLAEEGSGLWRGYAASNLAELQKLRGDLTGAIDGHRTALELFSPSDPIQAQFQRCHLFWLLHAVGDPDAAHAELRRVSLADEAWRALPEGEERRRAAVLRDATLARGALDRGEIDAHRVHLDAAIDHARELVDVPARVLLLEFLRHCGRRNEARAMARTLRDYCARIGHPAGRAVALGQLGLIAAARAQPGADPLLDEAEAGLGDDVGLWRIRLLLERAELLSVSGRHDAAARRRAEVAERLADLSVPIRSGLWPPGLAPRAEASSRGGDVGLVRSVVCTLVVTDLVDSTALVHRLGAAEAAALGARHDRAARDLIAAHDGREIEKTDGFLLMFDESSAAARFAAEYHRTVSPMGLSSRVGLHRGEVLLRENPAEDVARGAKPFELEGPSRVLATRVMEMARGGQSLATANALADVAMPASSLGHWQLRGHLEPIELVALELQSQAGIDAPDDTPAAYRVMWTQHGWRPRRAVPSVLPPDPTRPGEREDALQELTRTVHGGARLVTLLGAEGAGKTRLAIRFGWRRLGEFPGGVTFCPLSGAETTDAVDRIVAGALGLGDQPRPLADALAGLGRVLLILDGFAARPGLAFGTLGRWLDGAPLATFLVTSREVLGLPGEVVLPQASPSESPCHV